MLEECASSNSALRSMPRLVVEALRGGSRDEPEIAVDRSEGFFFSPVGDLDSSRETRGRGCGVPNNSCAGSGDVVSCGRIRFWNTSGVGFDRSSSLLVVGTGMVCEGSLDVDACGLSSWGSSGWMV